MNAVEIEEAISNEFPYAFLEAFGNKATTIKRLRNGSNKSDVEGGIFQYNNRDAIIDSLRIALIFNFYWAVVNPETIS